MSRKNLDLQFGVKNMLGSMAKNLLIYLKLCSDFEMSQADFDFCFTTKYLFLRRF